MTIRRSLIRSESTGHEIDRHAEIEIGPFRFLLSHMEPAIGRKATCGDRRRRCLISVFWNGKFRHVGRLYVDRTFERIAYDSPASDYIEKAIESREFFKLLRMTVGEMTALDVMAS